MPLYGYACDICGDFELLRPMAAAGAAAECPSCGSQARRLFAPPTVPLLSTGVRHALDAQVRSAHQPEVVVTTPPPTARRQRPVTDPRQARLPRP
jgi:putative FmdB family regulatory protein